MAIDAGKRSITVAGDATATFVCGAPSSAIMLDGLEFVLYRALTTGWCHFHGRPTRGVGSRLSRISMSRDHVIAAAAADLRSLASLSIRSICYKKRLLIALIFNNKRPRTCRPLSRFQSRACKRRREIGRGAHRQEPTPPVGRVAAAVGVRPAGWLRGSERRR